MEINKIHEDHRGSIHSITGLPLKFEEVSFLETKAGLARGGCIHRKNSEHLCVIQGEIEYVYQLPDDEDPYYLRMSVGDAITIPPNTPHYMISVTDSIIAEWGCEIEEKKEKHLEFRKIVLDHNEK